MAKAVGTVSNMKLFTTQKTINAAIADTKTRGVSLQQDLHVLACSVLDRIGKHKDMRTLQAFIESVPDMVRVNSLKVWFEAFGKVTFTGEDGKALKMPAYVDSKKHRLGNAMEKPFWSFKANEGIPYQAIDFGKWAEQAIKKLEKDAKETKRNYGPLITALKTFDPNTAVAN